MDKILRLEITDKCNLKCNMCWSCDWKHEDLSYEKLEKIIIDYKEHEENGTVVLTSREPLLSKNFCKVLDLCTRLKLDIKILTNGTLINEDVCKLILNSNVSFVGFSIHGDEKLHDSIVNVKGAYRKTINGIELLDKYRKLYDNNLKLRITTIFRKELFENIEGIIKIAKKNNTLLRIQHMMWYSDSEKIKNVNEIKNRLNYDDDLIYGFPSSCSLNSEEVKIIMNKANLLSKKYDVDLKFYPELLDDEIVFQYDNDANIKCSGYCDHPSESIRVRANGDVTFCQYIDKKIGNLCISSLDEVIYNNKDYKLMCDEFLNGNLFPICKKCCHYVNKKKYLKNSNYKI